jgi:MFS superfamily sulfate permease-like transporter
LFCWLKDVKGLCNIIQLFFQVTGSVVLLALAVMMPYCAFIPKTTLAAVIICAVVFSIDYKIVVPLWRSKSKIDPHFNMNGKL